MNLDYLYTFCQTVVIELPVYWYLMRRFRGCRDLCVAVLAINAITHPLVFFGLMSLGSAPVVKIAISEAFAPAFEAWALIYFLRIPAWPAVAASVLANLASWQLGPIFTY